jgi:hypothetical protein
MIYGSILFLHRPQAAAGPSSCSLPCYIYSVCTYFGLLYYKSDIHFVLSVEPTRTYQVPALASASGSGVRYLLHSFTLRFPSVPWQVDHHLSLRLQCAACSRAYQCLQFPGAPFTFWWTWAWSTCFAIMATLSLRKPSPWFPNTPVCSKYVALHCSGIILMESERQGFIDPRIMMPLAFAE